MRENADNTAIRFVMRRACRNRYGVVKVSRAAKAKFDWPRSVLSYRSLQRPNSCNFYAFEHGNPHVRNILIFSCSNFRITDLLFSEVHLYEISIQFSQIFRGSYLALYVQSFFVLKSKKCYIFKQINNSRHIVYTHFCNDRKFSNNSCDYLIRIQFDTRIRGDM